ncbi:MAG: ImmA/IrrE family metallo-endopeptidase [Verrucomicrobia bacterium]|nr:ImmA/IrrE family metallo-endopeptidase [Verrucomicrobiota bacterium]
MKTDPSVNRTPVILFIVDAVLRFPVIEMDEFKDRYGAEAAIAADFSEIYVDRESCEPNGPAWRENRLRFSLAHEIGHLYLHREEFEQSGFKTFDEFLEWTNTLGGRREAIEKEADEFAGRLLVPHARLVAEFEKVEASFNRELPPGWRRNSELRLEVARSIAPKFGVCSQTILTRFSREGIWPEI